MDFLNIITLILIFSITWGSVCIFVCIFKRSLISPLSIIPFFSFLYISGWIFHISYIQKQLSENDIYLIFISLGFIISFLIGGSGKAKDNKYKISSYLNLNLVKISGYVIVFIGFIMFLMIYYKYGIEFFVLGKGYRNLLYTSMGVEKFAKSIIIPGVLLLNYYYTFTKNINKLFYLITLFMVIIIFFFLEVRSGLAIIIFSFVYFYNIHIKKINNFYIFIFLLLLLFIGSVAKEIFYHIRVFVATGIFEPNIMKAAGLVFIQHEFFAWFEIFKQLQHKILAGETFYKSIKSMLYPSFIGGEHYSLTTWYVEKYLPNVASKGFGRGFSFLVEIYINFNILGVLIFGFLFGKSLKLMEDGKYYFIAMFFTATFPFVWTGNSATFLKQTLIIYLIFPSIIYNLLKILQRRIYIDKNHLCNK